MPKQFTRKITVFVIAAVLGLTAARSQEARELPLHPGNTLKFDIKFDGPDAAKVKTVRVYLAWKMGDIHPDQPGFQQGLNGTESGPTGPNSFRPEITLPDNIASGEYTLFVVANFNPGTVQYKAGDQFQLHSYRVENPRSVVAPKISVQELP